MTVIDCRCHFGTSVCRDKRITLSNIRLPSAVLERLLGPTKSTCHKGKCNTHRYLTEVGQQVDTLG